MDCLFDAYYENLKAHHVSVDQKDAAVYRIAKIFFHGRRPQFTYAGVAPAIVRLMCAYRGFKLDVQHNLITPNEYINEAESVRQVLGVLIGNFGEYGPITFNDAIYGDLKFRHAYYGHEAKTTTILAIKIKFPKELCYDKRNRSTSWANDTSGISRRLTS